MERVLKRHFWVVHLGFITLASLLAARTVNGWVGARLEPPVQLAGPSAVKPGITTVAGPTQLDATRFGHLFGIVPPPPPPPAEAAAATEAEAASVAVENTKICFTCEPVKTNLRLQLLGTMVASEKKYSMALISDLESQISAYYMPDQKVRDFVVRDIERDPQRVVIVNTDTHRLEYIDNVPGTGDAPAPGNIGVAPVPPPAGGDTPAGDGLEGVKQKSENDYSITRARLDSSLGNLNDMATQARMVPSFKNGTANGFKLFSIKPGSLYSAIGIQNGDVIQKINGFEMNSPDKALEIYSRLKDARNVDIEIERRGQTIKKHYNIE